MTIKKAAGIALLSLPFIFLVAVTVAVAGIVDAIVIFAGLLGICACGYLGAKFIDEG